MKKARRVPRKIGHDDEEEEDVGRSSNTSPVIKRATTKARNFTPKTPSNLSTSILSDGPDVNEEDVVQATTKLHVDPFETLERKQQARTSVLTLAKRPYRSTDSTDRPSYSADYLAELKQSQRSTPRDLSTTVNTLSDSDQDSPTVQKPLDIASKFGTSETVLRTSSLPTSTATHIPTDAEIREKKERRRRLAREEKDFISLHGNDRRRRSSSASASGSESDDDGSRRRRNMDEDTLIIPAEEISIKDTADPGSRIGVSALDDDDLAEGFEDFVEDEGRVVLGRKERREQSARRRRDIAAQIAGAEGGSDQRNRNTADDNDGDDDDEDPEERARLRAYEEAQTRHGTYGSRNTTAGHRDRDAAKEREERWRRITTLRYKLKPMPTLEGEQARIAKMVGEKRAARDECERAIEANRREREECETEMERVQKLVDEAGERLRALTGGNVQGSARKEDQQRIDVNDAGGRPGLGNAGLGASNGLGMSSGLAGGPGGRGLESFAGMAGLPSSSAINED